jgi:cytochrome c peroxidase
MLARSDRVSHKTALNCVKLGHFRPPAVNPRVRESEIGKGVTDVFAAAFPNDPQPITIENIANAISAYERTLLTPSPFDAYLAGNQEALSPAARAGLAKFINTGCVACHNGIGIGGATYQKSASSKTIGQQPAATPSTRGAPTSPRILLTCTCSGSRVCATWQ